MVFSKVLAKYYRIWYENSINSAVYCDENNRPEDAQAYRDKAAQYMKLINDNADAIVFFSTGDNAFLLDSALPEKYRGYK